MAGFSECYRPAPPGKVARQTGSAVLPAGRRQCPDGRLLFPPMPFSATAQYRYFAPEFLQYPAPTQDASPATAPAARAASPIYCYGSQQNLALACNFSAKTRCWQSTTGGKF